MIKNIPLSQQAYEQIKEKIITLDLPPGSIIDEAALQEELGVGRTPIREALKRLALENLVTIMPRRGMFVSDIGINDLQRLLEVRLVLERLAARLAAVRGTQHHWQRLEDLLMESIPATDKSEAIINLDQTFHEIIYEAADNRYLHNSLKVLLALNERLWYHFLPVIGEPSRTAADHRLILSSLKAGNGEMAAKQMESHIQSMQERLQEIILGLDTD